MKALLLAGGTGSRLYPLTLGVNKHLLPVGKQPMIGHALTLLRNVGIESVLIITTPEDLSGYGRLIAAGRPPYVDFDGIYLTVQHQPKGIADAIRYGESFVGSDESVLVMLADNLYSKIDEKLIGNTINDFGGVGCHVWTTKSLTPESVGILVFNDDVPVRCVEKPQQFVGDQAITGLYLLDSGVWDKLDHLEPSARGEYEITSLLDSYVEEGLLNYSRLQGPWLDLGGSLDQFLNHTCEVIKCTSS